MIRLYTDRVDAKVRAILAKAPGTMMLFRDPQFHLAFNDEMRWYLSFLQRSGAFTPLQLKELERTLGTAVQGQYRAGVGFFNDAVSKLNVVLIDHERALYLTGEPRIFQITNLYYHIHHAPSCNQPSQLIREPL